ncbi:MAG: uracil-DNA glycosylase [Treponema sp.]|jgi:DNA polymerase|nr:uracil-DNA glycosylase [Treponema sp.]
MKADEKQTLYTLLQKTAYLTNGCPASGFTENPAFTDDPEPGENAAVMAERPAGQTIEDIAAEVAQCRCCGLCKTRRNTVPGVGVLSPLALVVGEGPGADEDAKGEPFVGRAGQLLDKMLGAISLSRDTNCFIANIVKCRPPQNRDPQPDEETACFPFLERQIQALKPKMILAVGRIAAQWMLHTVEPIGKLRGRILDYQGIPFMATYHPSALLRNEDLKRPAWDDLKTFRAKLQELLP